MKILDVSYELEIDVTIKVVELKRCKRSGIVYVGYGLKKLDEKYHKAITQAVQKANLEYTAATLIECEDGPRWYPDNGKDELQLVVTKTFDGYYIKLCLIIDNKVLLTNIKIMTPFVGKELKTFVYNIFRINDKFSDLKKEILRITGCDQGNILF